MALNSRHMSALVARAAGTTVANTATACTALDVHRTLDGWVTVHLSFTLGSLTNATFTAQLLGPDSNWRDVTDPGALTLSADGKKVFSVNAKGAKQFRVSISSSGTITSSDTAVWYGWQEAGGALG